MNQFNLRLSDQHGRAFANFVVETPLSRELVARIIARLREELRDAKA